MKIFKVVEPRKIIAPTKKKLMSKITTGAGFCISTYGSGYRSTRYNSKIFIMYNCHKVRRKRGIRASHWVAYVYEFNEDLLKALGIRVKQDNRNFKIETKQFTFSEEVVIIDLLIRRFK